MKILWNIQWFKPTISYFTPIKQHGQITFRFHFLNNNKTRNDNV